MSVFFVVLALMASSCCRSSCGKETERKKGVEILSTHTIALVPRIHTDSLNESLSKMRPAEWEKLAEQLAGATKNRKTNWATTAADLKTPHPAQRGRRARTNPRGDCYAALLALGVRKPRCSENPQRGLLRVVQKADETPRGGQRFHKR